MKAPTKSLLLLSMLLFASITSGQIDEYNFAKEISGIVDPWHEIVLDKEIYQHINHQMTDLRIFGIKPDGDTIQAPYYLEVQDGRKLLKKVELNLVNDYKNGSNRYFVLQSSSEINKIQILFKEKNFDFTVNLAGSHNQKEWFQLLEEERLVNYEEQNIRFNQTDLNFKKSNFAFYRISIHDGRELNPPKFSAIEQDGIPQTLEEKAIVSKKDSLDKKKKRMIYTLDLNHSVPISKLHFDIDASYDFFRRVSIEGLIDSSKINGQWKYRWLNIYQGAITGSHTSFFCKDQLKTNKLRIKVYHQDNIPLKINEIKVEGYQHKLITQFPVEARYLLSYGKKKALKAKYDIQKIKHNIPRQLESVILGPAIPIKENIVSGERNPLFANKWWLWLSMGMVIFLLGFFTIKMMTNSKQPESLKDSQE